MKKERKKEKLEEIKKKEIGRTGKCMKEWKRNKNETKKNRNKKVKKERKKNGKQ